MKPLYVYMLRCSDGSYYIGHTDELERRIWEHAMGSSGCFTARRLPVELVFEDEFQSRLESLERERQLKGWSRAKKEALIRGDWSQIKQLAKRRSPNQGRSAASHQNHGARE